MVNFDGGNQEKQKREEMNLNQDKWAIAGEGPIRFQIALCV